jgi:hypothetical protein
MYSNTRESSSDDREPWEGIDPHRCPTNQYPYPSMLTTCLRENTGCRDETLDHSLDARLACVAPIADASVTMDERTASTTGPQRCVRSYGHLAVFRPRSSRCSRRPHPRRSNPRSPRHGTRRPRSNYAGLIVRHYVRNVQETPPCNEYTPRIGSSTCAVGPPDPLT